MLMIKWEKEEDWSEIHNIRPFYQNNDDNKDELAVKNISIILAAIQSVENYIKAIKKVRSYTAASSINSFANWIKNGSNNKFTINGEEKKLNIGYVYLIDYGNTFKGELAYYHYGLCIGIAKTKALIIPMRSGKNDFELAYHKINNPGGNKKFRQTLESEGFEKNGILIMNDIKYISAGRIKKETVKINDDVLFEIQKYAIERMFPDIYRKYNSEMKKSLEKIDKQRKDLIKIKNELNRYKIRERFENNG